MFYDVLWCFTGNEPSGWNRTPTLPRSLYWLLHRPSRVKLFRNFGTQPSRAAAPAWRMESMKYHGILKNSWKILMVNGCHATNINQPQKIAIASSWQCLQPRCQLPPSDDLPCATLPAMVGDPLPASPTSVKTKILLAHCEDWSGSLAQLQSLDTFSTSETQVQYDGFLLVFYGFPLSTDPKSRLRLAEALDSHSHRSGNCLDGGPSSWGHRCLWECGCLRRCLKMTKGSVNKSI